MLEIILGKTGSGKSMLGTSQYVIDEIVGPQGDDVYFVTNLPLNLGELNLYLQEQYPNRSFDITNRIRFLSDEETGEFYLHREAGVDLIPPTKEQLKEKGFKWLAQWQEAVDASPWRIVYLIDEAHLFFDAREWANVGPVMNAVISQHRKLKTDRIVMLTQFLKQLELRLREHAVFFHECNNWGMRRLLWWKLPRVFNVTTTTRPPPYPADHSKQIRFNPRIARCYDTTAGVGLRGGRAPEVIKRGGLPWWTAVLGILLLAVGLFFGPEKALGFILRKVSGDAANPPTSVPVAVPVRGLPAGDSRGPVAPAGGGYGVAAAPLPVLPLPLIEPRPAIWPIGWAKLGSRVRVLLSDGSVLGEYDLAKGEEKGIKILGNKRVVMTDGTVYHYRPALVEKVLPGVREDRPAESDSAVSVPVPSESEPPTQLLSEARGKSVGDPHPLRGNSGEGRPVPPTHNTR